MSANEWKLVPAEPTADMRNAYHAVTDDEITTKGAAGSRWAAMLAAAPTAPAQAASGGEVVAYTSERHFALREAHGHRSEEDYFAARPNLDGPDERTTFRAGFARGEKVYATPASAPPAGDPPAPTAAREVVEALRELLACHTESAGFTMSMAASTEDFAAFMDRQQARIDAAVAQARAALAAAAAQPEDRAHG